MRFFFKFIILLLISYSCVNKEKEIVVEQSLISQQILKDNIFIEDLCVIDSILIIKNKGSDNYLFDIYKAKKLQYIGSFGKIGNGPNEFERRLVFNDQYLYLNNELYIWLNEPNKGKLSLINVFETIINKKNSIDKELIYSPKTNFQDVFVLDSLNLLAGNESNLSLNMRRLNYYNIKLDSVIKFVKLFPKIKKKKKGIDYTQQKYNRLFINSLKINPNGTKFVSAMVFINRIDVFNAFTGKLDFSIENKINYLDLIEQNELKVYYSDIFLTDHFIYVLYNKEGILENDFYNGNFNSTYIIKYDWNGGKEIKRYKLDEPVFRFTVDEINKTFYTISLNEKTLIYKY